MRDLSTEDLRVQYEEIKGDWEFRHEGREFPLVIDITEQVLSSTAFDENLSEIEIATHLSWNA